MPENDATVTLDEVVIATLVTTVADRFDAESVIEAIDTLRKVRASVAMVAELRGADLDSVLHPADAFDLIREAGWFLYPSVVTP